jgi:hypothetical protein
MIWACLEQFEYELTMKFPVMGKIVFFNGLQSLDTRPDISRTNKSVKFFPKDEVKTKFYAHGGNILSFIISLPGFDVIQILKRN